MFKFKKEVVVGQGVEKNEKKRKVGELNFGNLSDEIP